MKNIKLNWKYIETGFYVLAFVLLGLVLGKIVLNIAGFSQSIQKILHFIQSILSPFIYGFFIAYFMNTTVRYLEKVLFRRIPFFHKRDALKRILSVILTYMFYLGCLIWILSFLIPEIRDNIRSLLEKLPTDTQFYLNMFYANLGSDSRIANLLKALNIEVPAKYDIDTLVNNFLRPVLNGLSSLTNIMNTVLSQTFTIASTLLNFVLGLMIAFYMLCDKEKYQELWRKAIVLIFKKRNADKILRFASDANRIIEKFIIGKALDSLIIGMLFFFICVFVKPEYVLLLTIVVGVTNMIPYFGPIVGAVIVTLLTLLTQPSMAFWILLIVFVLQQFDGLYLGPKILGDSTGLPPMLVIFAILVGGALFNVPGMFFGVPVFAIIRNLVSAFFTRKYDQKVMGGGPNGQNP